MVVMVSVLYINRYDDSRCKMQSDHEMSSLMEMKCNEKEWRYNEYIGYDVSGNTVTNKMRDDGWDGMI